MANRDTTPANRASRITFAARRFQKWEAEMNKWGLEVVWPTRLTVPEPKRHN